MYKGTIIGVAYIGVGASNSKCGVSSLGSIVFEN